jgi:hypothetical protein
MSIIFNGEYEGTRRDNQKLKEKIEELNPNGGFIRVSFDMTPYGYFNKGKEIFKGVARITNGGIVSFFKTVKSSKSLNIHSANIEDIKLLAFTKQDKINWQL